MQRYCSGCRKSHPLTSFDLDGEASTMCRLATSRARAGARREMQTKIEALEQRRRGLIAALVQIDQEISKEKELQAAFSSRRGSLTAEDVLVLTPSQGTEDKMDTRGLQPIGLRTDKLPEGLLFVRDLEAFEGPILSEYQAAEGGDVYVEKWCERQDGISRSLLVRSDPWIVAEFLGGRLPMLDLLTSEGVGHLIDRDVAQTVVAVWRVAIAEIPRGYLPSADRLHDEGLRVP